MKDSKKYILQNARAWSKTKQDFELLTSVAELMYTETITDKEAENIVNQKVANHPNPIGFIENWYTKVNAPYKEVSETMKDVKNGIIKKAKTGVLMSYKS